MITENEDPDSDGHVTGESGETPDETNSDAAADAAKRVADVATSKAKADKPTA